MNIAVDIWPNPGAGENRRGNAHTFRAALATLETALRAPAVRHVAFVLRMCYGARADPLPRVRELDWAAFDGLFAAGTLARLDRVEVSLLHARQVYGPECPWLCDEVQAIVEPALSRGLASKMRY